MYNAVASAQTAVEADLKDRIELKSLASWETRVYQYDRSTAADFGFTMGSVRATANSRLLIMDTMRSTSIRHGDSNQLWGCGFRFQVEVSDISLATKLTLPAIAAAMETTALEASVRLEVKGYSGDEMWTVIPSPKPLDVDTYRTYMGAVEKIQDAFAKHPDHAVPVLLAEDAVDMLAGGINVTDVQSSVLVVWALQRNRTGLSLTEAAADLATNGPTDLGETASELLARTYETVLDSQDADQAPSDEAKLRAGSYLETLLVKR